MWDPYMKRGSRTVRTLKWAGLLLSVLLLLASTVGWVKGLVYFHESGQVVVAAGGLLIDNMHAPIERRGLRWATLEIPEKPLWLRIRGYFWIPKVSPQATWVPFGFPLVFTATVTVFLFWLDRRLRRVPHGHCQACGYNLAGNISGICPECGEHIAAWEMNKPAPDIQSRERG